MAQVDASEGLVYFTQEVWETWKGLTHWRDLTLTAQETNRTKDHRSSLRTPLVSRGGNFNTCPQPKDVIINE